jgi:hypothetical protein
MFSPSSALNTSPSPPKSHEENPRAVRPFWRWQKCPVAATAGLLLLLLLLLLPPLPPPLLLKHPSLTADLVPWSIWFQRVTHNARAEDWGGEFRQLP